MKKLDAWGSVPNFVGAAAVFFGVLFLLVLGGAQDALLATSGGSPFAAAKAAAAKETPRWREAYGKLPLSFEENQGQTAEEVRYLAHGTGYELFLTPHEALLALRSRRKYDLSPLHRTASLRAMRKARKAGQLTALRIQFEGANLHPAVNGMGRLPARTNYFLGNDPKKWHTDVPSYGRVKYEGVYPGIDVVFYGNQGKLEYDFLVAPGADPEAIQLKIAGARKMRLNSRGSVVLSVAASEVELQKPRIYQMIDGKRRLIEGRYVVAADHRVRFSVAHYDRSKPLVLDPVLNYSTYLGGSGEDTGHAIAVDGAGNAFVAGQTLSADFPGAANNCAGASFVAELDPTGTNLLYATYLAGSTTGSGENAFGIAVDPSGKVYVTGVTFATDFPTTSANALNAGPLASNDNGTAYLTKLDPTVSGPSGLIYSTYIGGTGGDHANSVAVDAVGNAYVVGLTDSPDFPTNNPFQSALSNTSGNAFLTRIDTTQLQDASLIYSTYLGGNGANAGVVLGYGDEGFGVAADSSGNAYVVGTTTSTDSTFTTSATAYQSAPPANTAASVFVSRIATTQVGPASLIYSTYLAGSIADLGFAIALGPNNVAYVTGTTSSTDYPFPGATTGAFDTSGSGSGKAFITLVDTTQSGLSSVPYSTYLGGTGGPYGGDYGYAIKVDASGNAYVAGTTFSTDFAGAGTLKTLGAFRPTLLNPNGEAFIAKLHPAGSGQGDLLYATYFGGSTGMSQDSIYGIAIDSASPPNAYITGETSATDLPVSASAFQTTLNETGGSGIVDAYVAKLTLIPTLAIVPASPDFGVQPVGATSVPQTVTVTNNNNVTVNFGSIAITGTNSADFAKATDTCTPSVAAGAQCSVSVTFTPSVAAAEAATLVFTDDDLNSPQNVSLSGTGSNSPGVGLAPTGLDFGNQLLATTSAPMTVTLTNTGAAALTINSFAASGDFAATSTGASACPTSPATLAAGGTCTINVTFTPTASGARTGTLSLADDAGGSPQMFSLSGNGTAPGVGLAPTSLDFGNQPLATTSAPMTVTLTNTGTAALTINSFAASGDFAATSTGASACPTSPATLAAGANCTINVTFTPTASGARTGTLSLADNAGGSPQIMTLSGNGTAPGVGLAPTSLGFGNQPLATTSTPMTVTLTNTGTAALTINSFAASGDFAATSTGASACPTSPATLAAGANCTINVTFTPTASGARTGTLSVTDNAGGSPQIMTLSGNGTAAPDFGLTGPAATENVKAGNTLTFTVTMTPIGGFKSPVGLACAGALMGSTCTVSPASVAATDGATPQQAQVSMTTNAFVIPPTRLPVPAPPAWRWIPLFLALLLLALVPKMRPLRVRLGMATAVILLAFSAGCASSPGAPKGPVPVALTITGTSGTSTHAVQVNVMVQ